MASNAQLNYDEIVRNIRNQINSLKKDILDNDVLTSSNNVTFYSEQASSYSTGDYVWYDGSLYVCMENIAEEEEGEGIGVFDFSKWYQKDANVYNQFYAVISPLVKNLNFYVDLEQAFLKSQEKADPNGVYVAVRFSKAPVNFGASICNVYLTVLGSANKVKPTQLFFSAFASKYTYKEIQQNIQQIWVTPSVQQNFNEIDTTFRNLFDVSGTLIIGNNTVNVLGGKITYVFGTGETDYEEIPFMAFQDNFRNNLSPQPYGNTHGFAKSETNFSSYTFTISTYLLNTQLVADCMHIKGFALPATPPTGAKTSSKRPNDDFKLYIEFSNGYSNRNTYSYTDGTRTVTDSTFFKLFKLVDCGMTNNYGEIPMFTVSFTR